MSAWFRPLLLLPVPFPSCAWTRVETLHQTGQRVGQHLPQVVPQCLLDEARCFVLPLPDPGRGHDFQLLSSGELFLEFDVHLLLKLEIGHFGGLGAVDSALRD